ncbi:MAG: efflux RND transporter permease subunit [Methylophilaceae bacterium]
MKDWLQLHRLSLLFLLLIAALGGGLAAWNLPVGLFPNIDFPRIVVNIDAGDRPVDRMVVEVTQPLEKALRAVPEVQGIRTTSSRGSADLSISFAWGTNMVTALLQVQAAVNQSLPGLPAGTRFLARRMDPTVFPMLGLALTSKKTDLVSLRDFAYYRLRPRLTAIENVASVEVLGGRQTEYQVIVNPAKLQAMDLTLADVAQALTASNILTAVGRLEDHYRLYLTLSDTRLHNLEEIKHTILRSGANGVVDLADVAEIRAGELPEWTRVSANGHDAVLVNILQQRGANTLQIAKDVKAALSSFAKQTPPDTDIRIYYDQSELVAAAASSVRDAILIGALLAAIILFAFLRTWRITLVVAIVLPSVLVSTMLLLHAFNQTFNIMTLGGMAAAVGLIVDDTVVMLEHIMRRLTESARSGYNTVLGGAMEMARPLWGSSLATLVVFLPLAFLGGVAGGFFKALALTMAASLAISFIVAMLVVPLLADALLNRKSAEKLEAVGPLMSRLRHHYGHFMARLLKHPLWALPVILMFMALGYLAYANLGSGFMPQMDEGGFILDYKSPPGTSLTETDRILRQVEVIIVKTPEVNGYSRRTGLALGGSITEANEGDFFIHLKPAPRRNIEAIMAEIRESVETQVPGFRIETAQLMEDLIGDLTAVPQPIEVKLFGDDSGVLRKIAPQVAERLQKISGVVEVFNGIRIAGDAVEIRVDRVRAAIEGMDPDNVTRQLQDMVGGNVASQIQVGEKLVGLRVWVNQDLRDRISALQNLRLRAPDGHYLPLKRIAEISIVEGQAQELRENLKPMVAVTGRIEGRDLGSTMRDVQQALSSLSLPNGVYIEYGGLYKEQQRSFRDLTIVFLSAVLLVAALLLYLYEDIAVVLSIVITALISLSGVFCGLWLTGVELNISSMMGMTMVIGMVTEIAIFYFSELKHRDHSNGDPIEAGKLRMRPILMSSIIAILALMPLALGLGAGSAMQKPLAVAIISGLVVAVPLILLLMPALHALLDKKGLGKLSTD